MGISIETAKHLTATTTINESDYDIVLSFVAKINNGLFTDINYSDVREFTYIDDIASVGLNGQMVIHDDGGVYREIFSYINYFYLLFAITDKLTGFKESVYFNIVNIQPIEESTSASGTEYVLTLVESFLSEASDKSFKAYITASGEEPESMNVHNLVEFAIKMLNKKLTLKANEIESGNAKVSAGGTFGAVGRFISAEEKPSVEDSKATSYIVSIDKKSLEYFKDKHPTDILGENIYKNIDNVTSIFSFLDEINKNLYFPVTESTSGGQAQQVSLKIGEPGSLRCENLSMATSIDDAFQPIDDRRLVLRSYRDTFTKCFQNNTVYEAIISPTELGNFPKGLLVKINTPSTVDSIRVYPVNKLLVGKEWCNFFTLKFDGDAFEGEAYAFEQLRQIFNESYLYTTRKDNFPIDESLADVGYTVKPLLYDDKNLAYAASGKVMKSFFTLNDTVALVLPGHIYRKANEIIYIDKSLTTSGNEGSEQVSFGNLLVHEYYFVTKVVHTFKGTEYKNQLFACGFSNPK